MAVIELEVAPLPGVPWHILSGEAVDAAKFAERYWRSVRDEGGALVRAGLETAVGPRLPADIVARIRQQLEAAQAARTAYLFAIDPKPDAELKVRADFVLGEIVATLDWYLDDGVEDENDARFAKLGDAHAETGDSVDAVAQALEDYAALAKPLQAELDGLGGFDGRLIDEAPGLAARLRDLPRTGRRRSPEARAALADRNAKVNALYDSIKTVRAAARFVFRGKPEIVREATSAWARKSRAERARAARKAAAQPVTG